MVHYPVSKEAAKAVESLNPEEAIGAIINCWNAAIIDLEGDADPTVLENSRRFVYLLTQAIETILPGFYKSLEEVEVERCMAL